MFFEAHQNNLSILGCLADAVWEEWEWLFQYWHETHRCWIRGYVDHGCFITWHPWFATGFSCCTQIWQILLIKSIHNILFQLLQEMSHFRFSLISKMISITLMTNKAPITLVLKVFCMSSTVVVSMVFCGNTAALFTSRFKPFFPSREPTFFADSLILHGSATSSCTR